jgi:cyclase
LHGSTMAHKRAFFLAALLCLGGLIVACFNTSGLSRAAVNATQIEKVKDNLYVITGSGVEKSGAFSGGNTAVFITDSGVVVVDTKLPEWGQVILDRIRTVSDKPITLIINTHSHGDHTGSNEFFGASVETIAHENAKQNMSRMDAFAGEKAQFLPKRTFSDRLTLGDGKDRIDLYYFGPGHTNGDTFVVFPALQTMHAGDMFAWKALPYADASNGGSVLAYPETLAKAVSTINGVDTVITGHTPLMTWNDFREFAEFTKDFVAWGTNEMDAGKSVDVAAAEYKVPPRFAGYLAGFAGQPGGVKAGLQVLYSELQK